MRARQRRVRALLFLGVGAVVAAVASAAWFGHVGRAQELQAYDARFTLRGRETPPSNIAVVQIDDVSFNELNARWPFKRSLHGRMIDRLRDAGARTVVYDVQFTEPTVPEEDNALIEAVARMRHVVLATTEVGPGGKANVFGGDDVVRQLGARAADALFPGSEVIRRVPYAVDGLVSLAVASAESYLRRPLGYHNGSAWIDFSGPPGTIPTYSFSRVLRGKVPASAFRGKLVVVGAAAPTLHDLHPTAVSRSDLMSGVEVEANAVSTILRGLPLHSSPWPVDFALILGLSLIPPLASMRLRPRSVFPVAALAGILLVIVVQLAFEHGLVLPLVVPFAALVASAVGCLAVYYVFAAFERERVRDLFARFVPEQVVGEVLARTDGDLRLGGVRMEATVLFSDLRGFTTFAERLPAEEVIEILNRYLREMSDAILAHGGTLVSYIGDGIMAVFGAPIEQPDHADRALAAAREMLDVRLPLVNGWLVEQGHEPLRMGIGLNSGPLMSGNVGHERRLEYTAIGDTTNTASRLEGLTKGTPHSLFVADSTRELLNGGGGGLVFVGELAVRGRQAPVRTWSLPEPTSVR
jgi:adenylate cyclase